LKEVSALSDFICETCGKTYKSRSGLWKHQKKAKHGKFANEPASPGAEAQTPSPEALSSDNSPDAEPLPSTAHIEEPSGDTSAPSWMDWDFQKDEESTDTIPTAFKSIVKSPPMGSKKLSKAQVAALEKQNLGILKMGLTTVDVLLSKYGAVLHQDPSFEVKHSEDDKNLVANAQYRYMEEKGLFLTNYLSTGMIAGALTTWYVAAPVYRIRKKAKRKFFKGGLLSRLPLIGRLFKRKAAAPDIGQNTEVEILES